MSGDGFRSLDGNKLLWHLTNPGGSNLTVAGIDLIWPAENGSLKKIKLAGADIYTQLLPSPHAVIADGWHDDASRRVIAPGRTAELKLEFQNDIAFDQRSYAVAVTFAEGCAVELKPDELACRVSGDGFRKLNDKNVAWDLANTGNGHVSVAAVSVNWPETNGDLRKVKLGGLEIHNELRQPPVTTYHEGWRGLPEDRWIEIGQVQELKLEFKADVHLDQEAYSIVVELAEGCSVRFTPEDPPPPDELRGDKKARETFYPNLLEADRLHRDGITGAGVTIAVVDTGLWAKGPGGRYLLKKAGAVDRVLAFCDAIRDELVEPNDMDDANGHGSHIASILGSSRKTCGSDGYDGSFNGMAPDVDLVVVKAFDHDGRGSYLDVIRAIDFVVSSKDTFGVRVLNLSLSAEPRSHYWDDPLNQAVMAAWQAGIAVVASAGNTGPEPMTVGVPGNVPYIVTVGAMSDGATPEQPGDDFLATFSSAGPTAEGFLKPEVVAPGGHILGMMNKGSRIPKEHKKFHDAEAYFYMSGTSQAPPRQRRW